MTKTTNLQGYIEEGNKQPWFQRNPHKRHPNQSSSQLSRTTGRSGIDILDLFHHSRLSWSSRQRQIPNLVIQQVFHSRRTPGSRIRGLCQKHWKIGLFHRHRLIGTSELLNSEEDCLNAGSVTSKLQLNTFILISTKWWTPITTHPFLNAEASNFSIKNWSSNPTEKRWN